ncbi:MAG: hypothetical protein ACI4XM_00580 [Candidatus Coprovivens sp.]
MKKNIYLIIILYSLLFQSVYAETNTELENIEKTQIEELLKQLPNNIQELYEEETFRINPNWFDEMGKVKTKIYVQSIYIETTTAYDELGKVSKITSKEVSKKIYNSTLNSKAIVGNCTISVWAQDCWETNYKRLLLLVYSDEIGSNKYTIYVQNTWKNIPSIKSFDSIGVYYIGFNLTSANGYQYYKTNTSTTEQVINYGYKGTNMKIDKSGRGVSISQNIINDVSSGLKNELWVYGTEGSEYSPKVFVSYQHAVTDISLNTSHNFTFSPSGIGGVFDWNTSYSNWDNMKGLCYNVNSDDNVLWSC